MTETMADTRMQGIFEEEEARAEEERLRKQEEKKLDNALKSLMETEFGRRAMHWVLSITGQADSVTSTDPMRMMLLSARRDVGLDILRRLRSAGLEEQINSMREENK